MQIDDTHITLFFPPDLMSEAGNFFTVYDLINTDFATEKSSTKLKEGDKRVCRFCNQSIPKVSFKKEAHTIPEFLGNTGSISDFECDTCNKHFGKLENQLSNFLGPMVTLSRTRGKKRIPTSPSYDQKIVAKRTSFFNAKDAVEFGSTENSPEKISYDETKNQYSVEFTTQPYVPYDVYKSFLKMALGLLPESDLREFGYGLQLLQDIRNKKFIKHECLSVSISYISAPYNYTSILLFKRKDPASFAPPFSMVLLYGQAMYQIYIPFSLPYLKKINGKPITFPLLPPIIPNTEVGSDFTFIHDIEKLDSIESKTRNISVKITPNNRDVKMVALDPETKKQSDHVFDPHKTVKFLLLDSDFRIPLSDDAPGS